MSKKFLTGPDLAKICGSDLKTVHNWVKQDLIESFRTPGRHLRFTPAAVVKFLKAFGYPVPKELVLSPGDRRLAEQNERLKVIIEEREKEIVDKDCRIDDLVDKISVLERGYRR